MRTCFGARRIFMVSGSSSALRWRSRPSSSIWRREAGLSRRAGAPSCVTMRRTSRPWTCSWFPPSALSCFMCWSSSDWRAENCSFDPFPGDDRRPMRPALVCSPRAALGALSGATALLLVHLGGGPPAPEANRRGRARHGGPSSYPERSRLGRTLYIKMRATRVVRLGRASPLCKDPLARPLFAQRAPLHYNRCMALRPDQDAELRRLTVEGIRQQLTYAGPGRNAVVPGLGDGMMLRGDVEEHVAKRERKATRRLIWTNTALAIIGIVIAILAYYFRSTPTK